MAAEKIALCLALAAETAAELRVQLEGQDLAGPNLGKRPGRRSIATMTGPDEEFQEGFLPAYVKQELEGEEAQWQPQTPPFPRDNGQPQRWGSRDISQASWSPEEASDCSPPPGGEQREDLHPRRLLETPASPSAEGRDQGRAVKEEVPDADSLRRRFRRFSYQDAEGPREVYCQLRELCHQWLEPEKRTKEQILELVILEQLLATLPDKIQAWVREERPESCPEAVALAEEFLLHQPREERRWEKQALWPFRDTSSGSSKMVPSNSSAWPLLRENKEDDDTEILALAEEEVPFWKEKNQQVKTKGVDWILPVKNVQTVSRSPSQQDFAKNFQGTDTLDEDIEMVHFHPAPMENLYTCWDCGENFPGKEVLVAHQSTHIGVKPFICSECGQSFVQRSLLIAHEKTHAQEKPFSCPECGQSFSKRAGLVSHQKIHTGEKPHHCTECTQSFLHRYDLIRHLRIHTGEKPHECPDCGKGLRTMSAFHVHRRIHTDEKPYPCSACGKTFRHRANLIVHERIHTGEKPYKCEDCNKRFGDASSLRKHQRSHTGEKPYICPECGKRFSQNSGLVQHEKIHTGEKPFQCALCPKSFRDKSAIVAHQRTHTKERPYRCPVCGKCFGHRSNLIKHERIHSKPKKFKCL